VGFGAMCDDPFAYFFVDEHKIVTVRVEPDRKEKIEKIFAAFDLAPIAEPSGADAAAHEHRTVLRTPPDDPDLQGVDEIVERLRDDWRLTLNIDPESNIDDSGRALGETGWRLLLRAMYEDAAEDKTTWRYAEVLMRAGCLREAEESALEAVLGPLDGPKALGPAQKDAASRARSGRQAGAEAGRQESRPEGPDQPAAASALAGLKVLPAALRKPGQESRAGAGTAENFGPDFRLQPRASCGNGLVRVSSRPHA